MTEHTPGPWRMAKHPPESAGIVVSKTGHAVALVWEKEDAALIAAAPEMLAALRGLLAEFDKFSRYGSPIARAANEARTLARAVIARATGGSET